MRILITGASGLIGKALASFLQREGHEIVKLFRSAHNSLHLDPEKMNGADAVINLAGENIANGRWNEKRKKELISSRVEITRQLSETLASLKDPPKVFLSGSAIGFYGSQRDAILSEKSPPGSGFLAALCQQWEAATEPARSAGIRIVALRTGVVLSNQGGALPKMLTPFKLGLGGPIGEGTQYMSWISLEDEVRAIAFLLTEPTINGPVNLVANDPITNASFTKTLGSILHRPTFLRVPACVARLAFGEMADEMLLSSTRVVPHKLLEAGFSFAHPNLKNALKRLLE